MSAYQHTRLSVESDRNPQEDAAPSPGRNVPKPSAKSLRRSWYSLTFSDDEEEVTPVSLAQVLTSAACATSLQVSDACSDASTDVGDDFVDDAELDEDCKEEVELTLTIDHQRVQSQSAPSRPSFPSAGSRGLIS